MGLFLPKRWLRRPSGALRLSGPLTRTIRFVWNGALYGAPSRGALNWNPSFIGTLIRGRDAFGPATHFNGSSNAQIGGFGLTGTTMPYAYTWVENPAVANAYNGLGSLSCSGVSVNGSFVRGTAADAYNPLLVGAAFSGSPGITWEGTDLPPLAAGVTRRILVVARAGRTSTTLADYTAWVDGVPYAPTGTGGGSSGTNASRIGSDGSNFFNGSLADVILWGRAPSVGEIQDYFENPYGIYAPIPARTIIVLGGGPPAVTGTAASAGGGAAKVTGAVGKAGTAQSAGGGAARAAGAVAKTGTAKVAGGGAAKGVGSAATPVVGSAKSAGGGAAAGTSASARTGTAKAAGGGAARAQGVGANLGVAAAAGGGAAKSPQGVPGHTGAAKSAGGGAARAIGVQNVGVLGTARSAGGGAAISTTLANRIGWAVAGGGGAARATASGATHSGTAKSAGGGATRAYGAATPLPSSVDHYIHGWPVSKSGAVIVRIMP